MIRKVLKIILTLVVKACDMIYVFSILADQTQASAGPSFPHVWCFSLCVFACVVPPPRTWEEALGSLQGWAELPPLQTHRPPMLVLWALDEQPLTSW